MTHTILIRESLAPVAKEWKLDQPIFLTSFDQFLKKFMRNHPEIKTREDFAHWLKINPAIRIDHKAKAERSDVTTPLDILMNYAPRADDGRDKFLTHDPLEQFWFGSGTATVSQAFRHMEKPPFDLRHPLNTFGFPLGKVGQASERAGIYFDLAVEAKRLGEPYWAWNFLGCGLHYIEDLQNPYHSAQLLPTVAINGFRAYWKWGRKNGTGMIQTMTHVTANLHHYFEGYVEWMLRPDAPENPIMTKKETWLEKLRTRNRAVEEDLGHKSTRQIAKIIRNFSNTFAYDSMQSTLLLTGDRMLGANDYSIGTVQRPFPEEPTPYFNTKDSLKIEASQNISIIIEKNFLFQGNALRAIVKSFLNHT